MCNLKLITTVLQLVNSVSMTTIHYSNPVRTAVHPPCPLYDTLISVLLSSLSHSHSWNVSGHEQHDGDEAIEIVNRISVIAYVEEGGYSS